MPTMKRFYLASEQIKAGRWSTQSLRDSVDEVWLSCGDPEGGGVFYEFCLRLLDLSGTHAIKLELFDESWRALAEQRNLFEQLAEDSLTDGSDDLWGRLPGILRGLGWVHEVPEATKKLCCPTCGKERP